MRSRNNHITKIITISTVIGLGLVWAFVQGVQAGVEEGAFSAPSKSSGEVRVLEDDAEGVILELHTPGFDLREGVAQGDPCQLLEVQDYALSGASGFPSLPVRGAMVGIPSEGAPELVVLQAESTILPGPYDICPAARPIFDVDLEAQGQVDNLGQVEYLGQEAIRDEAAYARDGFMPAEVASLNSTAFLRSQRVAQVSFQPFHYNPVSKELRYYQRIRVQLRYPDRPGPSASHETAIDEGVFESTLKDSLVNYERSKAWRASPAHTEMADADDLPTALATQYEYKLSVNQDGLYQVSYGDLVTAGADLSGVDPHTLQLFNHGTEVAIQLFDDGDTQFESGEHFLFFGQAVDTRYSDTNVYFLTWGLESGRRMTVSSGGLSGSALAPESFTAHKHVEENIFRLSTHPSGPDNEVYYWDSIYALSPTSRGYEIELTNIAASSPVSATVGGLLKGYAGIPQHYTRILINNHEIYTATWASEAELGFEVDIPQSHLVEGTNVLTVDLPMEYNGNLIQTDVVLVNFFDIDYRDRHVAEEDLLLFNQAEPGTWEFQVSEFMTDVLEVLDISDPTAPVTISELTVEDAGGDYALKFEQEITGTQRFYAHAKTNRMSPSSILPDQPSNLRDASNGADYILISHADFITDVQPLADHRAAQGLRSMVVDVEDIYDEFNGGVMDPLAIYNFLKYANSHWEPPAPMYAVLVGDGHFDPRDYYHTGEPIYIPSYLEQVDPWLGETAAENRFVTIVGDDILPDMHLGRLPVSTSAQAQVVVDKILQYEQNVQANEDWNRSILFVADNPDSAGAFNQLSDNVADDTSILPAHYLRQKLYYKVTHQDAAEITQQMISAINEGVLVVNYIGHANATQWAANPELFHVDYIASLTNTVRHPFFVPMTCLDGKFDYFSNNTSMAESLLTAEGKGSVGSWSPTGLGVATGHDYLNRKFYETVFADGVYEIGPATMQAKIYLYNNSVSHRDLVDTYALFGDPAMSLHKYDENHPPSVDSINAPTEAVDINDQPVSISANFSDPEGVNDEPYTCDFDYDNDGIVDETIQDVRGNQCSGRVTYPEPGLYTVNVVVTDKNGASGSGSHQYVVIYDPQGGFVSGKGWFNSLAGAYPPDPTLTGEASFYITGKYLGGSLLPLGRNEFQLQVAGLDFQSTRNDWMVVVGNKATIKGVGAVNGVEEYEFLISVIDMGRRRGVGVDKFRIKIWHTGNGDVHYDNLPGAEDAADPETVIDSGGIRVFPQDSPQQLTDKQDGVIKPRPLDNLYRKS